MITTFSKKSQWLLPLVRGDSNKKIMIIDWHNDILLSDGNPQMNWDGCDWYKVPLFKDFIRETEKYDFVLIVCRETWQGSYEETYERNYRKWKDIDKELRNRGNIYFLNFSESFFYNTLTPPDRTLSLPWFYSNWYSGGIHHSPNFTHDIDYIEKDYTFSMLLGKRSNNRKEVFDKLQNRKDIYKTYFGETKYKSLSDVHLEDEHIRDYLMSETDNLQTMQDFYVPYEANLGDSCRFTGHRVGPLLSHTIPEKIYKNTHFDIISETNHLDEDKITGWTSEKKGKPLVTGRFFIWFGCLQTSSYLKKFGYELDSYVLNSYDNEVNLNNRHIKVLELINELENINYVKKVYNDTREARLHNMQVAKDGMQNSLTTIQDWIRDKLDE